MKRKSLPFVSAVLFLLVGVVPAVAQETPAAAAAPPAPPSGATPRAPAAPPAPSAVAPAPVAALGALTPPSPRAASAPSATAAPPAAAVSTSAQTPPAPPAPEAPPTPRSYFFTTDNFLGVYTEEVTRENMGRYNLREPRGVGVRRVVKESPAERAGLRENDVIVRFDGEAVSSLRKLNRLIDESAPEHTARVTILRGGSEQELSVKLGRRGDGPRVFRGEALPPGQAEALRRYGEEMRKQGEEWREQGERWRRQTEEWNRNRPDVMIPAVGTRRRLGVSTTRLTDQLADYFGVERGRGLLVTSVVENSAAAKAGLKAGDVITEVDGERVGQAADLSRAVNRKNEGELTLTVVRERRSRTVRITPERVESPRMEFSLEDFPEGAVALSLPSIQLPRIEMKDIRIPPVRISPVRIEPMKIELPQIRIAPINIRPFRLDGDGVLM